MAWLTKLKSTITHTFDPTQQTRKYVVKKSNVGILAFEIATIMPKLIHLWQSLSDDNIAHLKTQALCLEGVHKLVSKEPGFLLSLVCAEMVENVIVVAKLVSGLSKRCEDLSLRSFEGSFDSFANSGCDKHEWVMSLKEMEAKNKKMEQYVVVTNTLYREMEELNVLENSLKKCNLFKDQQKILDLQQKKFLQRQQVKYLKERSLWCRSFDTATALLAKSIFTILARIKLVFAVGDGCPASLYSSLSASAAVYPSDQDPETCDFVSGPLIKASKHEVNECCPNGFLEMNSKFLKPTESTLGASALALHYANVIIVVEKMIKLPHLVGLDARDDLYSMLPSSIRSMLRTRLKGVAFSASDPVLAGEWREALGKILAWLSPLAHNMIKWQGERSFEHQNSMPKTNVLLMQTLYYANQEKADAAITELLVGLNYIWRFEREMNALALLNCTKFGEGFDTQHPS